MTDVQRHVARAQQAGGVIWRHKLVAAATAVVLSIVASVLIGQIHRPFVASTSVLVVNGNTRDDPTLSSQDLPSIVNSTAVLTQVATNLDLQTPLIQLKTRLAVKSPAYRSGIYRIEYSDADRSRAILIANGVADELTRYYRQTSTARFDDELSALDAELGRQRERARQIDVRLQGHGDAAIASEGEAFATQLGTLEAERAMAAAALTSDAAMLRTLGSLGRAQKAASRAEILNNDEVYKGLVAGASASAVQLAQARAMYTSEYPGLPAIESKAARLAAAVQAEATRALASPDAFSPSLAALAAEKQKAAVLVQGDQAKVAAFDGLLAQQHVLQNALPSVGLLRLERDAARSDYLAVSARRAAALANRADALSLGSLYVIDRAITAEPQVGLSGHRLALIAALIILALSCSAAFIADQLHPRLQQASQVEHLYGLPVIATLGK